MAAVRIGVVALPWTGDQQGAGLAAGPRALLDGGLVARLEAGGALVDGPHSIELTDTERAAGSWYVTGVHGGYLADAIATLRRRGAVPLALLGDCTGALGVLGGLRRAGARRPGVLWFDAHADFNTPESTRSGRLYGMPLAVAAGLCLARLRHACGLEPPIDMRRIVLAGVRETDPEEQQHIEEHRLAAVRTADLRGDGQHRRLRDAVQRLSEVCDALYLHIDTDVLDPNAAPGVPHPVPSGPSAGELAACVALCCTSGPVAAIGIAAYQPDLDRDGRTGAALLHVAEAAVTGLRASGV